MDSRKLTTTTTTQTQTQSPTQTHTRAQTTHITHTRARAATRAAAEIEVKQMSYVKVKLGLTFFDEKIDYNRKINYKKLSEILKDPLKKEKFDNYDYRCSLYVHKSNDDDRNMHFSLMYELHKAFLHRHLKSNGSLLKIESLYGNDTPNLYYYNGDFFQQEFDDYKYLSHLYIEERGHREHRNYISDKIHPRRRIKKNYDKSCEITVEIDYDDYIDDDHKNFSLHSIWCSIRDLTEDEWIDIERCNKNTDEHYKILRKLCWYKFE
jgi:hypothetical protein